MADRRFIFLDHRGIVTVSGEDRRAFLQGIISNDIEKAGPDRAIYAAFLTPQGKFLHEFFITERDETFFLDCEAARAEDLRKRLSMYRLRSKVQIAVADGITVAACIGEGAAQALGLPDEAGAAKPLGGGVACVDPRLAAAGVRAVLPAAEVPSLAEAGFAQGALADYDAVRMALGLPDGSRDLIPEKAILLENGFDELHGVDWKKGCYLGQELTARTKYRGLVRKRLMPVEIDGPAPEPGTPLMLGATEAGEMRSASGSRGLAVVRIEQFERLQKDGGTLTAGEARLIPKKPDWVVFQTA